MSGGAGQHVVAVAGIHQDLGDVLAVLQADVGPVLAAIGRLEHAVADRHAVASPGFARADPHDLRIRRIDRDSANRLHVFAVEDRLVGRAAVHRLPYSAARRAHKDRDAAVFFHRIQRGNSPAHGGRTDVARRQSGNGRRVEAVRRLRLGLQASAEQGSANEPNTQLRKKS